MAGALACFPQLPLPHLNLVGIESLVQQLALVGESISKSRLSLSQWACIRINASKEMANEMVDLDNPLFAAWAKRKHVVILNGYLFITEALMTAHSQKLRLYFSQLKGNQAQDL